MDVDPWRNPFVAEDTQHASSSSSTPISSWTSPASVVASDPALLEATAPPSWDPAGDEADVWTWQSRSTPAPSAPKVPAIDEWEPATFETRSWAPPRHDELDDDDAYAVTNSNLTGADDLESRSTRDNLSSPWGAGEETAADVEPIHPPRLATPPPLPETSDDDRDDAFAQPSPLTPKINTPPPLPLSTSAPDELSSPWDLERSRSPHSPHLTLALDIPRTPSPVLGPGLSPPQPFGSPRSPHSPDAFGSFEAAVDDGSAPWPSLNSPGLGTTGFAEAEPTWGAGPAASTSRPTPKPKDEWEQAVAAREQRDRVAPPGLVAAWLREFESLLNEQWKPAELKEGSNSDWRSDIAALNNASSLTEQFLPPITRSSYPTPTPSKSTINKASLAAIKLTRHNAISQSSPLAILNVTRGSTSWEESVKKYVSPNASEAWGVLGEHLGGPSDAEKEAKAKAAAEETSTKKGGGLLSFLGRKSVVPSPAPSTSATPASVTPPPVPAAADSTESRNSTASLPRSSIASLASLGTEGGDRSKSSLDLSSPTPIPTSTPSSQPQSQTVLFDAAAESSAASTSTTNSAPAATTTPDPTSTASTSTAAAPPSAVSRFLGRFSRTKSDTGNGTGHRAMAMSESDMSFLGDIPSKASVDLTLDEDEEDEFHLAGGLMGSLNASGLGNGSGVAKAILPPALAPPPRAPPRSTTPTPAAFSTADEEEDFGSSTAIPAAPDDDMWDFFTSAPAPAAPQAQMPAFIVPPPSASGSTSTNAGLLPFPPSHAPLAGLPRPRTLSSMSSTSASGSSRSALASSTPTAPRRAVPARMSTQPIAPVSASAGTGLPTLLPPPGRSAIPPPAPRLSTLSIDPSAPTSLSIPSLEPTSSTLGSATSTSPTSLNPDQDPDDDTPLAFSRRIPPHRDPALRTPMTAASGSGSMHDGLLGYQNGGTLDLDMDLQQFGDFAISPSGPAAPIPRLGPAAVSMAGAGFGFDVGVPVGPGPGTGHVPKHSTGSRHSVPLPSEILAASAASAISGSPLHSAGSIPPTPPSKSPFHSRPTTLPAVPAHGTAAVFGRPSRAGSFVDSERAVSPSPVSVTSSNTSPVTAPVASRAHSGSVAGASGGLNFDFLRSNSSSGAVKTNTTGNGTPLSRPGTPSSVRPPLANGGSSSGSGLNFDFLRSASASSANASGSTMTNGGAPNQSTSRPGTPSSLVRSPAGSFSSGVPPLLPPPGSGNKALHSSWSALPPPLVAPARASVASPPPLLPQSTGSSLKPAGASIMPSAAPAKSGLSAQDLSFFEGL